MTVQILANDFQVLILCLSYFITTVVVLICSKNYFTEPDFNYLFISIQGFLRTSTFNDDELWQFSGESSDENFDMETDYAPNLKSGGPKKILT